MMIDLREKRPKEMESSIDQQIIVGNRYIFEKKIGKGSFGEVYKGFDKDTNQPVAIKIELSKTFHTKALVEGKILKKLQSYDGIPKLLFCGTEGDYNVLVLELLGPNLEDIMNYCDKKLSLKTVIMIADQLIQRIETIHNRGFIHRDIKPDNFLIGAGENIAKVYAIDFGLSKRYVHPHTGEHILIKKHKGLIGTARFASINAHLGLEQSRRDDLQALGYLFVYLAKGELPWQQLKAKTKQHKYKKILDMKDLYTPEALAEGLPEEFTAYLTYVKRLEFEEKPDYGYMRGLFHAVMGRTGMKWDLVFDWMIPRQEREVQRCKIKRKFKTQVHPIQQQQQQQNKEQEVIGQEEYKKITSDIIGEKGEQLNSDIVNNKDEHTLSSPLINLIQQNDVQNDLRGRNTLSINKHTDKLLPAISEKQEDDQMSQQRVMAPLRLLQVAKMQSDVNVQKHHGDGKHYASKRFQQRLYSPSKVRRSHTNKGYLTYNRPKSSQKFSKGGISDQIEEPLDLEENIEEDIGLDVYTFNIKESKLQKEKTSTPIPIKNRTIITYQLDTFQSHLKQFSGATYQIQASRARAGSHDIAIGNQGRIAKHKNNLKDSSMLTEYEDEQHQDDSYFCIKVQPNAQQLRSNNTSSEGVEVEESGNRTRKKNVIENMQDVRQLLDFKYMVNYQINSFEPPNKSSSPVLLPSNGQRTFKLEMSEKEHVQEKEEQQSSDNDESSVSSGSAGIISKEHKQSCILF